MTGREVLALPMPTGWQPYGSYTSLDSPAIILALMRTTLPWRYIPVDAWVVTVPDGDLVELGSSEQEVIAAVKQKYGAAKQILSVQGPQSLNAALAQARAEYSPTTQTQTNTTPPASTPTPATPATTVRLTNLTTGNAQQFRVGDQFRVEITGAANSTVSVLSTQNGTPGQADMGRTDASGRLILTGSMSAKELGTWTETWKVGGVAAPTLAFSVVEPPSPVKTSPAPTPTPPPAQTTPTAQTEVPDVTPTPSPDTLPASGGSWPSLPAGTPSSLQDLYAKAQDMPWYVWLIAAAALFYFARGGDRRYGR